MTEIHILARAVIQVEGQVLLAQSNGATNTFLPGGHVKTGESVASALQRELREEMAEECTVHQYLGAIEHAWDNGTAEQHEINHLFRVTLAGVDPVGDVVSNEPHLTFAWHHRSRLHEANLEPYPLINLLSAAVSPPWWASTL